MNAAVRTDTIPSADETVRSHIAEMVRRIAEKFRPEKVILFGSHARGTAGPDSDVDLLVVLDVPPAERRRLATRIDLALWGIPVPCDVIVASPGTLEAKREHDWTVYHEALKEGVTLYERAA